MGLLKEFKEFAVKGNVVDLAVGVIIGGAFGKIVTSLVSDIIMPLLGLLVGGINFTDWKIVLKHAGADPATQPAVTLNIGNFIQTTFDFLIIAFAIFMAVKLINKIRNVEKPAPAPPVDPAPTKEEILLTEIRDILKNQSSCNQ